MNTQQPSRPVITPAMREQAVQQPNTWLYVVDPIFTESHTEVPPWGFIGGYRVDERGELTDDFSPNPNYRPSPVALRLPAPGNDVERALQLTTTGYAQGQVLLSALLEAELILFAQPQGNGLFTLEHESGRRQLQVFTSESYLPSNWTTWQRLTGKTLAQRHPAGIDLQVNPTSSVKARVPGEDLIRAAGGVTSGAAPEDTTSLPAPPKDSAPAPSASSAPSSAPASSSAPAETAPPAAPGPAGHRRTGSEPATATSEESTSTSDPSGSDFGQRFLGTLLGGAIGDALGAAVEFYPVDQIRSRYGDRGITDYDRTGDQPGGFTDDTQMTLFTLEGLIRGHIAVRRGITDTPLPAVQLAYQRWLHTQGYAWERAAGPFATRHPAPDGWLVGNRELFSVRSPGSSGITALREFASGAKPGTFDHPINESDGCGGTVRAAPVALWSDDPQEVFELAGATAALTYSEPSGYLPAGVLGVLVHWLLRGESLVEALRRARTMLDGYSGAAETERALAAAVDLAERGEPTAEQLKDTLGSGWSAHETLAIAVCAVLSTEDFASAVLVSVNHSGDSDSTGAVCGNLAGALYGSSALPGVWLRDLRHAEIIRSLGRDALLEFGGSAPDDTRWAERYPSEQDTSELPFVSVLPRATRIPTVQTSTAPVPETEAAAGGSPEAEDPVTDSDSPAAGTVTSGTAEPADTAPGELDEAAATTESATPPDDAAAERSPTSPPTRADPTRPATDGAEAPSGFPEISTDRVRGCLLGGAVGDALGYAIEFDSLEAIRHKYGEAGLTDYVDAHRPGGSISDDTQMTLFTLEGLIRASIRRRLYGETEPATQVQYAYQRWLHTQGFDWRDAGGPISGTAPNGWLIRERGLFVRRAPGTTCIQALHGYASGREAGSFGHRLNDSKGCGGVMRAAPAGLWSEDTGEVFRVGALTGVLTHGHPSGFLPAGALAVITQQLLSGESLPTAVTRALDELSAWDDNHETTACIRRAVQLAADGDPSAERIQQQLGGGWVGEEALAIAIYAALTHPKSFSDAIVLAANHSGDSDSTAAICGNIMGASLTVTSIPQEWLDKLELRAVIEQLSRDAVREFGPNPPEEDGWLERYPVGSGDAEQQDTATTEATVGRVPGDGDSTTDAAVGARAESTGPGRADEPGLAGGARTSRPDRAAPAASIWAGAVVNHETNGTELADDLGAPTRTGGAEIAPEQERSAPDPQFGDDTGSEEPHETGDEEPPGDETDPGTAGRAEHELSEEELQLLAAWRRFREGDESVPVEVNRDLRKLLVEAFGSERAEQLAGEVAEPAGRSRLGAETPLELDDRERLAGCVLGGAVGDSLGAPWMLLGLDRIRRDNPDGIGELAEVFGGRGRATAITQQAVFVLDGLVRARVRDGLRGARAHRPTMVRIALEHWLCTQGTGFAPSVAPGTLTDAAELRAQRFPDEASVTALTRGAGHERLPSPAEPPNEARDAAAAARGAVLGLSATDPVAAVSLGAETAVITHGGPDGYLPAAAVAGLVSALSQGHTLARGVETVLAELDKLEGSEATARGLRSAVELAENGPVTPEALEALGGDRHAPAVLAVAVAAALWHPDSFSEAVSLAATHSGNSAGAAAVCGSLLGTSRGTEAIPGEWLRELELRDVLDTLLADHGRVEDETFTDQDVPDWVRRYLT